ncbi:hypothetical protein BU23DRAFT_599981 [Bimuria novae-zelandiae CBS 107.79]|uniref:F-box domain-containing protein n=1 Tax=Bimuria novae-zelandiae CBS 107.79 TaxID=1447943 RepID=A0A6A5V635_9PLEO|nr:hypothetical protein BU23DRAFT_599981 [Bimuria novae-zelandiae CBS 107.79]
MAHTLSFSPLSLDLPSSRMSVDFSTFIAAQPKPQKAVPRKPQPPIPGPQGITRKPIERPLPLPNVQEEPEQLSASSSQKSRKWPWATRQQPPGRESPAILPMRKNSNASTTSITSEASTAASSVFSRNHSISTSRTSLSSVDYPDPPWKSYTKPRITLTSLPVSLLETIFEYALCLPLTVSVGPPCSSQRHMQYRYHRAGLDYIDIQLIRKHPLFLVSHHIRAVALDVFLTKCDFVIDLHRIYHTKVSSTVNDNLKAYERFWIAEQPPKMVADTLGQLSRLSLRLPVPSCENGGHRGRAEEDWMDGSDGRGGGGWKIKSLKREQDDAARILRCLEAVMKLVMADPSAAEVRGRDRRSRSRGRSGSLKRSLSRARSKSRGRRVESRADSRQGWDEQSQRRIKRLEVTLVKKTSHVMVLPEVLGLIKLLRSVPVSGFTKYFFELEEQQVLWASKHRKRWQGFEPDGTRLLEDLQNLSIADRPLSPIRTPTQFQFVKVDPSGRLRISSTPVIVLERPEPVPPAPTPVAAPAARRMGLPWARKRTEHQPHGWEQWDEYVRAD